MPEDQEANQPPTSPVNLPEDNTYQASTSVDTIPPLPPRRSRKSLILVLVFVLLAGLIGAGTYMLLGRSKTKPNSQQVEVKKDIPLVTYGTVADGVTNHFYPKNFILYTETEVNYQVYEGLVAWDNLNSLKPNLATGWTTPDDTTWEFKLKPDVKFHSGRTMTAKDVKYSLMDLKDEEIPSSYATTIKSVDVVDDHTVRIHTDGADPLLLNRLALLYIVDSEEGFEKPGNNGSGPYEVKSDTAPTEKETQLVAFDDWHGGHQYTRAITYKVFDDRAAATDALKKKEINFLSDVADTDAINDLKNVTGYEKLPSQSVVFIGFNVNKKGSPLQNLKVREAFRLAVDGSLINEKGKRETKTGSQLIPQDFPGYNPDIPKPNRDVEKAKALLKEAGYPNGVTIVGSYSDPSQTAATLEMQKQLAEAGITLKLNKYDDTDDTYFDDIIGGKIESWRVNVFSDLIDGLDVFQRALPPDTYSNKDINDLLDKASKTLDASKRLDYLKQASLALYNDAGIVPLGDYYAYWFHDPSFVVLRDTPNGTLGASFAKVYSK